MQHYPNQALLLTERIALKIPPGYCLTTMDACFGLYLNAGWKLLIASFVFPSFPRG